MWDKIEAVLAESFVARIVAATIVIEAAVASLALIVHEMASLVIT